MRARREDGFSLVVVVVTLGLLMVLSSVALKVAVAALGHSTHQAQVKRALHAADAAVDAAIYRLNRADLGGALNIDPLAPGNIASQTCVVATGQAAGLDLTSLPVGMPSDPQGRKWCPETAPESMGGDTTFQYRVSQLARVGSGDCAGLGVLELDREIVAIGRSGDVTRRVKARMRASLSLLSGAAVQSASTTAPMLMSGASRVLGTVQSNHNIVGSGANVVSGNAIPGPGSPPHTATGVAAVGSLSAACQRFTLPQVGAPVGSATDNPASIPQRCLTALLLEGGCTLPLLGTLGGVQWDPAQKTLRVFGSGIVTLTGDQYEFCSIRLEGSAILRIPSSVPVSRIFLRDPASCGPGGGQITVDGQARIVNCHLQTQPQTLQLYAIGNATTATTQTLAGGGNLAATAMTTLCGLNVALLGTPMTVYAPRSLVALGGSTAISGQVAANTVHLSGAAAVQPVSALINLNELGSNPILPLYHPTDYQECPGGQSFTVLPLADPAQGC